MKDSGYIGQIDTNSIVTRDGVPIALEFTPRCGYDATPTLVWGDGDRYVNDVSRALGMLESGSAVRTTDFNRGSPFYAGLRVHIPPYPFVDSKDKELVNNAFKECQGVPLDFDTEDFFPYDVMLDDDGRMVCAGTGGTIGVAMGAGSDPRSAGLAALRVANRSCIPNKGFRIDGWERAQKEVPELIASKLIKLA